MSTNEPRRLTPTERLHEISMAAISRVPREPESSVDLTLNAKGDVQIAVTAKGGVDVGAVGAAAQAEFDRLCKEYPRSEPSPEAEAAKKMGNVARIQTAKAKKAGAA